MKKGWNRCVCGKSSRFPLCDGDHGGADWTCTGGAEELVVVAAGHLRSVAERLAHHLGGVTAFEGTVQAKRAIWLTDGTELHKLRKLQKRSIEAEENEALAIDIPAAAVAATLGFGARQVQTENPLHLWRGLLEALDQPVEQGTLRRAFLSHAVADERTLQPVLDYLRKIGAEVFLCADSIAGGEDWRRSIEAALSEAEVFVLVVSEASVRSTYCAFECGFAAARGLPVRVVLLDDSRPPAFLAHLQAIDLPRLLGRRPWLSADEALAEALLEVLV